MYASLHKLQYFLVTLPAKLFLLILKNTVKVVFIICNLETEIVILKHNVSPALL